VTERKDGRTSSNENRLHVVGKPRIPKPPVKGTASKSRATAADTAVKAQKMVQLVASGMTVAAAGAELKMQRAQASKLYNAELQRMIKENDELRTSLVVQELETLRLLKLRFMRDALGGDEKAARIVLGVVDRNMDLLGLKAAIQVQVSNARIDTTITDIVGLLDASEASLPKLLETDVLVIEQGSDEDATG
jgi:hypothetical protein